MSNDNNQLLLRAQEVIDQLTAIIEYSRMQLVDTTALDDDNRACLNELVAKAVQIQEGIAKAAPTDSWAAICRRLSLVITAANALLGDEVVAVPI